MRCTCDPDIWVDKSDGKVSLVHSESCDYYYE
jgi:hypothetical protein